MAEDQEMVDVEVVDVETEDDATSRNGLGNPSVWRGENRHPVDNVVVIKEQENSLTIAGENADIGGVGSPSKEEEVKVEKKDVNGASCMKEGSNDENEPKVEVPTYITVVKNDYGEESIEENGGVICIQPLNSDNPVKMENMEVVEVHFKVDEGKKRVRKRVPRKIEKIAVNENGEPIEPVVDKPYKCEMCHWQFKQRYRYKRHMRTHTGERPYQCPQCEKQFSRSHILKVHMMIHTGEKPFICEECGWSFMKKYHLQRHMRTHTGEMPFVCQECGVHFSRQYYLKKHLVSAHNAQIIIKPGKKSKKAASGAAEENPETKGIEVVCQVEFDPSEVADNEEMLEVDQENSSYHEREDDDDKDDNELTFDRVSENGSESSSEKQNTAVYVSSNLFKPSKNHDSDEMNSEHQNSSVNNSLRENSSVYSSDHRKESQESTQNQNGATVDHKDSASNSTIQNGNAVSLAGQNSCAMTKNVSTSQNRSEASLKECIEMVNQLVERKPMEPMIIKRDVNQFVERKPIEPIIIKRDVATDSLNINNETESHVDLPTIPVK